MRRMMVRKAPHFQRIYDLRERVREVEELPNRIPAEAHDQFVLNPTSRAGRGDEGGMDRRLFRLSKTDTKAALNAWNNRIA